MNTNSLKHNNKFDYNHFLIELLIIPIKSFKLFNRIFNPSYEETYFDT